MSKVVQVLVFGLFVAVAFSLPLERNEPESNGKTLLSIFKKHSI